MFDKIHLVTGASGETGYAYHARSFWKELEKIIPQKEGGNDCYIVLDTVDNPLFYADYPGYKIAYNVWESTLYPDTFFKRLLEYDQLWVPSFWQRKCAIEQGYPEDRVKVVPEGVDGSIFKPGKSRITDGLTRFLIFGRWEDRKYTTEMIRAFLEAFPNNPHVSLKLSVDNPFPVDEFKTTQERMEHYGLLDDRIENLGFLPRDMYIKMLQAGDVFLSCSRAEGWNLPLMEALACGIPSICSNYGAQLDFAYHAIKVKIKEHKKPINVYHMPDCPGTWAEPDFDDLVLQIKKVYGKLAYWQRIAMKTAQAFRTKWSWENAAKIAYKELEELSEKEIKVFVPSKPTFFYHFIKGAFIEIKGSGKEIYDVVIEDENKENSYTVSMTPNHWAKSEIEYYKKWEITVRQAGNIVFHHKFNLEDKRVLISLESKSLGDCIAWIPYIEEFRKKHKCQIIAVTWHNRLFRKVYPEIKFETPGTVVPNLYAQYNVGVFFKDREKKNPVDWRAVPLQKIASDILGLEYEEIRPKIDISTVYTSCIKRPKKYVCISEHSTAVCKYWHHPNGWQTVVDEINKRGFNVVDISKEPSMLKNVIHAHNNDIDVTMGLLLGCEYFIGLASGLAWLAWALGKPVVMISGFSAPFVEFQENNIRIEGVGNCTNCLNDVLLSDRAWDEGCFHNRDFSCTKNITSSAVIARLPHLINENILDFTSAPILRFSKRQTSFKKFLNHIHNHFEKPTIVEIGTVRRDLNDPDLPGDGNSTSIFAWYVKNYKGSLFSCDIDPKSIATCNQTLAAQNLISENVFIQEIDGLKFLEGFDKTIAGIYIDGLDWYPDERGTKSAEFHLSALKLAIPHLTSNSLVMFDDVFDSSFKGKGQLAIPYALDNGFEIVFQQYQVILLNP